ncbi:hypothetical protein SEA_VIBAKI_14 [Arthrobacter phage Vibaki]|uniref:Tail terminator n=1 Tax=Arthrobacter phage Vibaki TaxID=2593333 RepID=A0A514TZ09_9CAUD|nr:hypothetical protein HYP95_gp14 [Arthrobacter phage Vibaki]QDK01895.1 hypothetical protein SEA_VIBAKI_14 [Arthrobacter phage Vibaki]
MLGAEGVTRGMFMHAVEQLPGRMALLRARYGATTSDLPDFASFFADEIATLSIEKFPAIAFVNPGTTGELGNRQTDVDTDFEEYSYRYRVQVYVYAMADTGPATSLAVKRCALAVREAYLADKILPVGPDNSAEIDPRSIVESYSELDQKDAQYIAAAFVQFEVVTHERLDHANPFDGPAEIQIEPAVQHPYFDE